MNCSKPHQRHIYENNKYYGRVDVAQQVSRLGAICRLQVEKHIGSYDRITEQHFERCYEIDELTQIIQNNGMKVVSVFGDMSEKMYKNSDERVYFIVKKD